MNFETIAEYCLGNFLPLHREKCELDLFKSVYSGPMDAASIATFLHELDLRTNDALSEKLDHKIMDMVDASITKEEKLMYMLRLENAVVILNLLSEETRARRKLECELSTEIPDEAILWAMTCLWSTTGFDHIHRVAESFSRSKSAFLKVRELP